LCSFFLSSLIEWKFQRTLFLSMKRYKLWHVVSFCSYQELWLHGAMDGEPVIPPTAHSTSQARAKSLPDSSGHSCQCLGNHISPPLCAEMLSYFRTFEV
jgi:hypothetical protein